MVTLTPEQKNAIERIRSGLREHRPPITHVDVFNVEGFGKTLQQMAGPSLVVTNGDQSSYFMGIPVRVNPRLPEGWGAYWSGNNLQGLFKYDGEAP